MNIIFCAALIVIICGGIVTDSLSAAQLQFTTTLTWQDNSNNEDGFGIEMLSSTSADFMQIESVGPNTSQHAITLSGNYEDNFCFRVFAFNAAGSSSDSNVACKILAALPPSAASTTPDTPNDLHSTLIFPNSIGIAWQDVSCETQYVLQRHSSNTTEMEIILAGNQTSFTDQDLKRSHTYCYRIAATNNVGLSPFTDYVCLDTPPQDAS